VLLEEFEAAVDAVVIRDRHQIHAARLGGAIHLGRRRVAITAAQERQVVVVAGMVAVDVEIGLHAVLSLPAQPLPSGFRIRIWMTFDPLARYRSGRNALP